MSASFDYDKAMEQINVLLEELQDPKIKMADLEKKVLKAQELIQACDKELSRVEDRLDKMDSTDSITQA